MKYLLALLCFVSSAFAMDTPIIFGGNAGPSNSTTQYLAPSGLAAWTGTEASRRLVIPTAGTIYNLKVTDSGSKTGKYVYTLYKNGSPTSLTCDDSAADCKDLVHTVSVTPGDTISLECVPTSPDALFTTWSGTLMFNSTTSAESLIMGTSSGNIAFGYYPIQSTSTGNVTVANTQAVMPTSGTIDHLYIDVQNPPGNPGDGFSWSVSIIKNGGGTVLGATVTDNATSASDLTHSISFAAGDLIAIAVLPVDTPASTPIRWAVRWRPDTDGESVQLFASTSLGTSSSTQYQVVSGGIPGGVNATEDNRAQMMQSSTVQKLYTNIVTAVGVGNTITMTVMAKKTPSAVTCPISGGSSTTCNDTTRSYSATLGDQIDMKLVKSAGMPANDAIGAGLVTFITPPTPTATPAGGASNRMLVGIGN